MQKIPIPLDTHVHRTALELGITKRKSVDRKTAMEITEWTKSDIATYDMDINMCVWTITIYANAVVTFKEEEIRNEEEESL